METTKKEKTDVDLANDIWEYYLKTQISVVPVSVLEDEVLGEDDKWRVNKVIDILEKKGCVTTTSEFGQRLCNFYTNPEDIKRNLYKVKCDEDASIIVEEKYDKLLEIFTAFMKKQEGAINIQEAKEWLASEVIRCGYTHDERTSWYVAHKIIIDACLEYIIDFVDFEDDSQEYIKILSQEESKALKEKDDREIKEKKEKEFRPIREELLRVLAGDVKMTVWEIKSASGILNEYSTYKITSWLEWRENVGEVEEVTENEKRYFMLKGATERLQKKKEEEERQELKRKEEEERQELKRKEEERLRELSRRENVKNHNDEIDKKISVLESDISKWEKVYSENKNKLFGDGAKAKKEAQMKLEELKTEITSLENKKVWVLP